MTELQKEFEAEAKGYPSWINADLYPDGKIYTKEYTEWLEKQVQALRIANIMPRFVLMGFEYNDLWKAPDLFSHENEDGILITVDEWDKAEKFETMELAEYKRQYLQVNYNDYTWYVVRLNEV